MSGAEMTSRALGGACLALGLMGGSAIAQVEEPRPPVGPAAPAAPTAPTPAPAGSALTDGDWQIGAAVATDVPASVGLELWATTPSRVRLGAKLGLMPGAYVGLVNSIATGAGWYTDETADLIASALDEATVLVLQVGWQPRADWGLFIDAGYGLVTLSGAATSGEVLQGAVGGRQSSAVVDDPFAIDSTLHTLRVDIGWRFDLPAGLYADARIGGLFTLASSTRVEPTPSDNAFIAAGRESLAEEGKDYLDETYTDYVHSPLLGLALGWRFL